MKLNSSILAIFMAGIIGFTSCNKTDDPIETKKSDECKIKSFKLVSGNVSLDGFIYESEKVIEVAALPDQLAVLNSATAVVEISDKATISPDPTVAADYTVENGVQFTVTAEDEVTQAVYTVLTKEAEFNTICQEVWKKTYGDLNIKTSSFGQSCIGFSGNKIVTRNLEVLNLEGVKVGDLNLTGVEGKDSTGFALVCVTNDHAGHLVASVGLNANGGMAPNSDGIAKSAIYIWEDGWDQAPKKFYENTSANVALYMSAAGDLTGTGIVNVITPGRGATTMFHTFMTPRNAENGLNWAAFNTNYASNDGNWGQMVSSTNGKSDGQFVVCDSQGSNQGMKFYVRNGITSEAADVELSGTVLDDNLAEGGGSNQYGNYSTGHARAFTLNGRAYVVAVSSGWPCTYVTIQTLNPEDEDHYLLRTQVLATPAPVSCSAYYYDETTGKGYVAVAAQSESPMMVLYEIITEVL